MSTVEERARERVARGAALLDEKLFDAVARERGNDWRYAIDLARFSILSSASCVLGQLYDGDYAAGLDALGITDMDNSAAGLTAADYGFDLRVGDLISGAQLEAAWVELLEAAQAEGRQPL